MGKMNNRRTANRSREQKEAVAFTLNAIEWDQEFPGFHPLVIVSAEVAVKRDFIGYAQRAREPDQLAMLIFDEAHVLVKDRWTAVLDDLWRLAEIGPRRIGFSATVPAYIEAGLTQALCLNRPRVTRAFVVRANIRYEVHAIKDEESVGKLLYELVGKDATAARWTAPRTMVFAGTEAMVNDIADRLGGHRYYTKMDPSSRPTSCSLTSLSFLDCLSVLDCQ